MTQIRPLKIVSQLTALLLLTFMAGVVVGALAIWIIT